jgi:putative ABC transport system permease protein
LNASAGDSLVAGSLSTTRIQSAYTVTAVESSDVSTVQGELPVAVFHLSELQRLTGADVGDQADQILVRTNRPQVKPALERTYADATVVTRASLTARQLFDSRLPLAVSLAAALVGFVVSTLFLTTTMGLEVEADRPQLGVLSSLGFSTRARLTVILTSTVVLALLGSLLGCLLGIVGIFGVNLAAASQLGMGTVAIFHPLLPVLAVSLSVAVGLAAAPYPLALVARTDALRELTR